MKKYFLPFLFLFLTSHLWSQNPIDSLVLIGIEYHDKGDYKTALKYYNQALEIDNDSPLVNYEMGMTYMYLKEYKKSIKYCDKVLKSNDKYLLETYITKGSCLDYLGKVKESIALFEKGIKEFGGHYLLYYNLALNHYKLGNSAEATEATINAINENSNHSSSHFLLGHLMADANNSSQSLLSLHYFLLLDPDSKRASNAYFLLQKQFGGNVEKDKNNDNHINIFMSPTDADSEFSSANLMILMLSATKSIEENVGKSDEQLFVENTESFFIMLGELKKKKNKGLWWDFYIPFYEKLAKSEHIEAYCYYISQFSNEKAIEWLTNNSSKIEAMGEWMKEN